MYPKANFDKGETFVGYREKSSAHFETNTGAVWPTRFTKTAFTPKMDACYPEISGSRALRTKHQGRRSKSDD